MFDYISFLSGFWLAAGLMIAAGAIFLVLFEGEGAPETSSVPATDDEDVNSTGNSGAQG